MRSVFSVMFCCAVFCLYATFITQAETAHPQMEPGLMAEIYKPFLESKAFPLETLIAFDPAAALDTYRGRCLALDVFGVDQSAQCEPRMAVTYTMKDTSIHWFSFGAKAYGLESEPLADTAHDLVLRILLTKVHVLKDGDLQTVSATGDCRIDAFYIECHAISPSGRIDVNFAKAGGKPTRQFPVEDNIFRIPNSEIFTARGQCISFHDPRSDLTPYCAGFAGQALIADELLMTFFTIDARTVYGFSGSIAKKQKSSDGRSFILPVTSMLRVMGEKAGTAPISGTCREQDIAGRKVIDCKVTTKREGAVFEASFETKQPWQKALRPQGTQ